MAALDGVVSLFYELDTSRLEVEPVLHPEEARQKPRCPVA